MLYDFPCYLVMLIRETAYVKIPLVHIKPDTYTEDYCFCSREHTVIALSEFYFKHHNN